MNALSVLVFNSGSSSLKFSFFRMESSLFEDSIFNDASNEKSPTESILNQTVLPETFQLKTLLNGEIEMAAESSPRFCVRDVNNKKLIDEKIQLENHAAATLHIIQYLAECNTPSPEVIAHRVVHGGPNLRQHCLINDKVIRQLEASVAFAPLHNQAALSIIYNTRKIFPHLPHIACFDTTFHVDMPDVAKWLPIAKALQSAGIQRYGFHGLSCESIVAQLGKLLPEKLIIAHLGNGASVTAIKNGQSIDTSMGLTPSGGLMMGTRSGDIDPGVLIYLMREKGYDLDALDHLINHESGLLGISGLSGDMRILHRSASINPQAQLAIDLFCYAVTKQIAAMIAVLNGIDLLVFTAGIGENDALIRAAIVSKLTFFGLRLDSEKNQAVMIDNNINDISDINTQAKVMVIRSTENAQIARHAYSLLN